MPDTGTEKAGGKLRVKVVTPEGSIYDGAATFVAVPAKEGEMGVLTMHTPLIAQLGIGELRIKSVGEDGGEGRETAFAVRGGFVQVLDDHVILLATEALGPGDIDPVALKAEHEEILEKLRHPESDEQYWELLDDRRWAETREKVAG